MASRVAHSPPLFPKTLLNVGRRYLLRHPWQTVLMILGIMLGVAVVVAIDLANASAARAFDLSTDAVVGRATHQLVGGPSGLDEQVYINLRRAGLALQPRGQQSHVHVQPRVFVDTGTHLSVRVGED